MFFSELALEQRIVIAKDGLWEFRDQGRAFETHNSLTSSWSVVPHPVNPLNWFLFYNLLRSFLTDHNFSTIPDNRPTLYLQATIHSPCTVLLHAMYRFTIYKMFLYNVPPELYFLINRIKFRFFLCPLPLFHVKKFLSNIYVIERNIQYHIILI